MRLNELDGFVTDALIMVKFTKKERVQDFLDGKMYMNNFKYFIDQEKIEKKKGQGDAFEAGNVLMFKNASVFNSDSGQLMFKAKEGNIITRYIETNSIPMLCLSIFGTEDFKVISQSESSVRFRLDIPEEEKQLIKDVFAADRAIVTFNSIEFIKRFNEELVAQDYVPLTGKVNYHDFSYHDVDRAESFEKGEPDFLFNKDHTLSYQREYRFILPNERNDGGKCYNIGKIDDLFQVMTVDQFLHETEIEMVFKKEEF